MAAKILVPKGDLAAATLVCAHSIQVALIGYSIVVNCAMMTVRLAWPAVVVIALLTLAVSKLPNEARAQGPDELASLRAQVSQLYSQGKYAEAVPIAEQYVALARQKLGDNHAEYAAAISWLANVYQAQGRYAEAEPLHKRSLAIVENAVGPDHSYAAAVLNNLAELYYAQGRYPEAEPLYKRALAIREKALGPEHPAVGQSLNNLSGLYFVQRDWARAADFWRRSTGLIVSRAQRVMLATGQAQMGKQKSEAEQLSFEFWGLVKVTYRLALNERNSERAAKSRDVPDSAMGAKLRGGSVAAAMAARGAKGDPRLAALVRERQDRVAEWQQRDKARSAAVAQAPDRRNPQTEAANAARLVAIDTRIGEIDGRLKDEFPDYAALVNPTPLSIEDVQAQLGSHEALVLILDTPEWNPTPEETFLWVVTKTDARWVRSEFGTQLLRREVTALRCGLDATAWWSDTACAGLSGASYTEADYAAGKPLPFDLGRAHGLYKSLFRNAENLIKGKQLLIVPAGALTTLPFQVLVTKSPASQDPASAAWLIRDHAIAVLPSVASLAALRRTAKPSAATKPMIGFGNPLLDGDQSHPCHGAYYKELADLACSQKGCAATPEQRTASLRALSRSFTPVAHTAGIADLAELRRQTRCPRRRTSCAPSPAALARTRTRSGSAIVQPRPRSSASRRPATSPATVSCTLRLMGFSPANSGARASPASS